MLKEASSENLQDLPKDYDTHRNFLLDRNSVNSQQYSEQIRENVSRTLQGDDLSTLFEVKSQEKKQHIHIMLLDFRDKTPLATIAVGWRRPRAQRLAVNKEPLEVCIAFLRRLQIQRLSFAHGSAPEICLATIDASIELSQAVWGLPDCFTVVVRGKAR